MQADAEIKLALQSKNRNLASTQLLRKKQYEQQVQKLWSQQYAIEQQLITLEATEDTAAVLETLTVASDASKAYKNDADAISQALSDLAEQKESSDRLNERFTDELNSEDQDELMRELEKLTLEEGDSIVEIERKRQQQEALDF